LIAPLVGREGLGLPVLDVLKALLIPFFVRICPMANVDATVAFSPGGGKRPPRFDCYLRAIPWKENDDIKMGL